MPVTSATATVTPLVGSEIQIALITGGPLDNLSVYAKGGQTADNLGQLVYRVYAVVGTLTSLVAISQVIGVAKAAILQWVAPGAGSSSSQFIEAGGTEYILTVAALPLTTLPYADVTATIAGVNEADVAPIANTSSTLVIPAYAEVSSATVAGFAQFMDVGIDQVNLPYSMTITLYANNGIGSVEAAVVQATIAGPDSITAIFRQVVLPVASVYRVGIFNINGVPISVPMSIATYISAVGGGGGALLVPAVGEVGAQGPPGSNIISTNGAPNGDVLTVVGGVATFAAPAPFTQPTVLIDPTSPPVAAGKAVISIGANVTLATTAALPLALYQFGIAATSGVPNTHIQVITQGYVDPALANVGPGFICAVGTDAIGNVVRVTDPTVTSGLKFVGICDANGAIYVSGRKEDVCKVEDFGLVADGSTPNDVAMEALRVFMTENPYDNIEFGSGIYNFAAQIGGLGVAGFPFGTNFLGQGISDQFRVGALANATGTVLQFTGPGVGLHIGYAIDANYRDGGSVAYLEIRGALKTGVGDGANINLCGLEIVGAGSVTVKQCRFGGFKYQLSVDGGEAIWVHDISFDGPAPNGYQNMDTPLGDNSAFAVRIGSFSFTVPGSANGVYIMNCQFNNCYYGVLHDDGVTHVIANSNFELPGAWGVIHGPTGVIYNACQGEAQSVANLYLNRDAGPTTCTQLTVTNCFFAQTVPAIKMTNVAVYGLVFTGNYCGAMHANGVIIGSTNLVGPNLIDGNQLPTTGIYTGAACDAKYALQPGVIGTPINHAQKAQASIDVLLFDATAPLLRLRDANYVFFDEWRDTEQKIRTTQNAISPDTGLPSSILEAFEWNEQPDDGGVPTHSDIGKLVIPEQCGGFVTINVVAIERLDSSSNAFWIIRQRLHRTTGGNVTLDGVPVTIDSDSSGGFTAPTIVVDIVGQTVAARVNSRTGAVVITTALVAVQGTAA